MYAVCSWNSFEVDVGDLFLTDEELWCPIVNKLHPFIWENLDRCLLELKVEQSLLLPIETTDRVYDSSLFHVL